MTMIEERDDGEDNGDGEAGSIDIPSLFGP